MSEFYALSVQIALDEAKLELPEIQEAIEYLNDCHDDGDACEYANGVLNIEFANHVSNSAITTIDDHLRTIGEHARDAAVVHYEFEGEQSFFAIGPDDKNILDAELIEYLYGIADNVQIMQDMLENRDDNRFKAELGTIYSTAHKVLTVVNPKP